MAILGAVVVTTDGPSYDVIITGGRLVDGIDRASFDSPPPLSAGMEHVFVTGTAVITDGQHTNAKPGRLVRGPGWTGTNR